MMRFATSPSRTEAPPLLPLLDVGEMHLDDGDGEQLRRVVDSPGVVRPRPGVDDDAVGPVERVVTPVDELAFVVRLPAAHGEPISFAHW